MESGLFCSLSDVTGAPLLWSHSRTQKMNHINKSHLCIALQLSWGQLVAFEAFWNLKKWRASNKVADVDVFVRYGAHWGMRLECCAFTESTCLCLFQARVKESRSFLVYCLLLKESLTTKARLIPHPAEWSFSSVTRLWMQICLERSGGLLTLLVLQFWMVWRPRISVSIIMTGFFFHSCLSEPLNLSWPWY